MLNIRNFALAASLLLALGSATAPATLPLDGDIVLDVDPKTHVPLGELVPANGLLLDPRDLPEAIWPHLIIAEGLDGLEASLSALFARSVGFATQRKKIAKRYGDFSKHQSGMWADLVADELERIDWEAPNELIASAMYFDTGRRISPSKVRIVGPPQLAFAPIGKDALADLLLVQSDVALFSKDMPKEAAARLLEVHKAYDDDFSDPWFGHGSARLLMLSYEMFDDQLLVNPFDMTGDEFMARIERAMREALVEPLFPALPDDVAGDDIYFLEGLVFTQGVAKGEDWPEVPELESHNAIVHQPILLLQIQGGKPGKAVKSAKRVRIAMVLNGETRTLHDGKWPMK